MVRGFKCKDMGGNSGVTELNRDKLERLGNNGELVGRINEEREPTKGDRYPIKGDVVGV